MLDLNTTFSAHGTQFVTPMLRSFMSTFQVGIRNRDAVSPVSRNMYVKAFGSEEAVGIASLLIKPYDMVVTGVMSAGSEGYGEEDVSDADPIRHKNPLMRAKDFLEKNKTEPVSSDDLFGF